MDIRDFLSKRNQPASDQPAAAVAPTPDNIRAAKRNQRPVEERYAEYYAKHVLPSLFGELDRFRESPHDRAGTSLFIEIKLIEPPFQTMDFVVWLRIRLRADCPSWHVVVDDIGATLTIPRMPWYVATLHVLLIQLFEHVPS